MYKFSKFIRILTVAPLMAIYLLSILLLTKTDGTKNINFVLAIIFLAVLPILAYPIQKIIPALRKKGRTCQRNMALIFAIIGYFLGIISAFITQAPNIYMVLYTTYLLSGTLMIVFNKTFNIKFSGHACGVAGPIIFLAFFVGPWVILPGMILLVFVYRSSIIMNRHNFWQLTGGAFLSVLSFLISFMAIIH